MTASQLDPPRRGALPPTEVMGDLPGGALGGLRGGALDGHHGQRPNLLMVWVKTGCDGLDFILGPLQFGGK